jgi:hypothetical protein
MFKKLSLILLAIIVLNNGIFNYLLGEFISEGFALASTFIFFINKIRFKFSRYLLVPILILVMFIIIQIIVIIYSNELIRILFIYPYLLFLFILLIPRVNDHCITNGDGFLLKAFVFIGLLSSVYALAQRCGFDTILSLENEVRATGLSRSSLNLTGCLLATFGMGLFCLNDGYKKFAILSILFIGLLAAGGRGGAISALILLSLSYYKKFLNIEFLISIIFIFCLIMFFSSDSLFRTFGAFNFTSDQSNIERMKSYLAFFNEFEFMGSGVGTTSPAAQRFIVATGFESSLLNTIFEIGIPFGILIGIAAVVWYKRLYEKSKKIISMFILGLLPVLIGQQLYGIPSAFCALIIAAYILSTYNRQTLL